MKQDVVIIGSGISGLTAAAILARNGRKVTIIEKKSRPGGALKRFKRKGFSFDVGFHYTGCLGKGEILTRLWNYCGVLPKLNILPFPEQGNDCLYIKGQRKPIRAWFDYDTLAVELKSHFPDEIKAIDLYFTVVKEICADIPFYNLQLPLTPFLRGYKMRPDSLADFLKTITSNPFLQAALAVPVFLYGVPVDMAPLATHATVAHSYYSGAYSIGGGGQAIVDAFVSTLREQGVEILTDCEINSIQTSANKISAVITNKDEQIKCSSIIYTGHPAAVADMVSGSVFRPAYRTRLHELKNSISMFALFTTIPDTKQTNSLLNWSNHFLLPQGLNLIPKTPIDQSDRALMLTCTDRPENNSLQQSRKTAIFLRSAYWQDVAQFENSKRSNRPEAYLSYKQQITTDMLKQAETTFGLLADSVEVLASGSPLTFRDELTAPEGCAYGAMHCLGQFTPECRTRLPGLYLSGQSTLMTGIIGSALAGMISAGEMIGLEPLWEEIRQCS